MLDSLTSVPRANRVAFGFHLLLGALAGWLFLLLIAAASTQPLLFDGAMNLEVSRSLAEGNGPRRLYDFGTLFAPEVQTKEPYILLGALVFKMLGVGHFQAQLPNLIYLAALCCVVFVGLRRTASITAALLATVLILSLPLMYQYGLNGYGEIPTFTFGLAALLSVSGREITGPRLTWRCGLAGILAGLAIATKIVGIILAGSVGLVILIRIACESKARVHDMLLGVCAFIAGMATPLLLVEAWRLAWLGLGAYGEWWNYQLSRVLYQAGVSSGPADDSPVTIWSKITIHFGILAAELRRDQAATAMLLIVPVVAAFAMMRRPKYVERWIIAGLLTVSLCYLLWWLAVTPTEKAWLRRIYIGLMCMAAISGVALANSLRSLWTEAPMRKLGHAAVVAIIVWTYLPFVQTAVGTPLSFNRQTSVDRVFDAARVVSELDPQALVFGYGWYSAPHVSLYSGRGFIDLTDFPIGLLQDKPAYLVADRATFVVGMLDRVLARYPHKELLPTNHVAQIYLMDFTHPVDPFRLADASQARSSVTFSADPYPLTAGMEPFDPIGGRFIESDSEVLLKYEGQSLFNLVAYMDQSEPSYYLWPGSLEGRVILGQCEPLHFRFDEPGWRDFKLPLEGCPLEPGQLVRVRILLDNVFDWSTLKHIQKALLLNSIGFVDEGEHRQ